MPKKTEITKNQQTEQAELAALMSGIEVTGLEDVDASDLKLAAKLWNMKGVDGASGKARNPDMFMDTVTEEMSDEVSCVLLSLSKSRRWDEFDNGEQKTFVHCQSADAILGTMADGTTRHCANCPDKGWGEGPDGKQVRKCGKVYTAVGVEDDGSRAFTIRFKKTGLDPFLKYINKHFLNAFVGEDGKRSNIPLFFYKTRITLQMHESGNYALPVFELGDRLPPADIKAMTENAKAYRDMMSAVMDRADQQESRAAKVAVLDDDEFSES